MMRRIRYVCLGVLFAVAGCSHAPESRSKDAWAGLAYAKVVGYAFECPASEPHHSLMIKSGVDELNLKRWMKRSVQLDASQTDRLLEATFKSKVNYVPSACYEPHHIFVFYGTDDKLVAAIEVCFSCRDTSIWPGENGQARPDFPALARLSSDLGLGLGSGDTLEQYLEMFK